MSDTQPALLSAEQRQRLELLARQQQAQQRQILAMMGIGQWVRPDSPTLKISDLSDIGDSETQPVRIADSLTEQQPVFAQPIEQHDSVDSRQQDVVSANTPVVGDSFVSDSVVSDSTDIINDDAEFDENIDNHIISATATNKSYNFNDLNSFSDSEVAKDVVNASDATSLLSTNLEPISFEKVAPFDLQGGRYGNWVLVVDIQALNSDSQKLWQNITQALSLQCETSSFPICEGMDTAELANASLAGYIFKIGQSEDIKIAVLTALPEGLTHPNFIEVPSLEAMLDDSMLKRQLWQQLCS